MKLKKIASLMLAGIMAVSMLAGCKSGTPNPNPNEGDEGNTTSGYSAMLGEAVADTLKAAKHDDVVTFADNGDDQIALEDALGNIGATDIRNAAAKATLQTLNNTAAKADFKDAAKLHRDTLISGTNFFDGVSNVNNTRKVGQIYYIDGSVEMSKVIAIHDLSLWSKSSLSLVHPVLEAMGHETFLLPTMILSTQSDGYPHLEKIDLSSSVYSYYYSLFSEI